MCVYFGCSFLQGLRGFKVTNSVRSRTVGVACRSFDELVDKSCQKLDIPRKSVVVQLLDGTIVDDEEYFQTLPQHMLLIFLRPGENSLSGADILYNALQAINLDFLQTGEQVKEFFSTDLKNKVRQLAQLISDSGRDERTTLLSSISQDPLWFQGLDTRSKSKEEVMFRSAQDRVRGYLYKTNDAIKKSELYKRDKEVRDRLTTVMASISTMVKEVKYFGDYFNRNADLAKKRGDASTQRYSADLAKEGGGHKLMHQHNAELANKGGDVSTHQCNADLAKKGGGDVSTHQRNADLAKKGGGDVSTHQRNADLAKEGGGDVSTHQRNADLAKEGGDVLTQRLCDDKGEFQCQGRWDRPECLYNESSRHVINPYCSKEARVLFQIWNLDHRIERSRTVVPAILEAASISVQEHRMVNCSYFFTLLFTLYNLKLVHIVCHDKGAHNVRCDPVMYFLD
uniref:CIDE-N domain-containing protein n=1 Tax=Timema shepardi TaxID=629360 RepID=A0A7R9AVH5_TIMSH|nr:unnamed protein product [Timema shepardi]